MRASMISITIGSAANAASDKCQHGAAGIVEPLGVLDDQQNRRACRRVPDQLERCESDHEQLASTLVGHARPDRWGSATGQH
jgi:hypothetical protein